MSLNKDKKQTSAKDKVKQGERLSLRERFQALQHLPAFFRLIWQVSPKMFTANVILRVVRAAIPVTTLYIGKLIIDEVVRLTQASGEAELTLLFTYIGLELLLAIVSDAINRATVLLDSLLGDKFANESSVRLMQHAGSLDLAQFEDADFYDKLERARRQTVRRTTLMTQVLSQFQSIITIGFLAAGLVAFNPWLILLILVAVVPAFLGESHFNERSYSLNTQWTPERRELDYFRFIGASDETAKEVKIFGLSDFLVKHFSRLADKYYLANRKVAIDRARWGSVFATIGSAGYYGAYVMIILQTVNGQLSIGDLTFLAGSFSRLRTLLENVLNQFSSMAEGALYLQDFFDFFEMKPLIAVNDKSLPVPQPIQGGFTFEKVGFKYPNTNIWAVRNLSFTLHAGEKLALVGENGAGKTTIIKLITRLYDPNEGRILLDGRDLREYNPAELREAIGVIFQDFVRYQMNASTNIAVGKIEEKDNRLKVDDAAYRGMADQVISKLPKGYEQMIGRRFAEGVNLSGGEWQKIAISRAYMRDAQLLVLDEPTAALDARAEYEVFRRFADLTEGKSAVLISHRFSTVRMADRILVLEKGGLLEIGTHEELLIKGGKYAELFDLQAQGYR
ncbi:ATP-binding cassette subfamily B protein [Catalinimonas alkaloidigena]|uniref:ABC transporter ATP-binding protein n=1 Tax=Catalinimonas alkaloidigena TaxID=1075417 RepID=UPI00240768F1|nr:ABC transporter ATP-binding protein [Catalinimonas alkaloidigena]MDF9795001.1 ATP-binding cassette subfamily B protein [Catalinimonas alkaloidigena]